MADLLVPLYGLPVQGDVPGFHVRRPMAHEARSLEEWGAASFSRAWASEMLPGLFSVPATVVIAQDRESGKPAGFCCWDCTALGFLGPVGVSEEYRGNGLGRALVLSVLHRMREQGYGYAVVGDAGPVEFFQKICDARVIQGSSPGVYSRGLVWP